MSPEENELLDRAVAISGHTKQDYIISKLLDRAVVVQPNPRVYKALRNLLQELLDELKAKEPTADMLEIIRLINATLYGIKGNVE